MNPLALIAARHAAGLTVTELAAALNVTPRAVRNWEAGAREIPAPVIDYLTGLHARIADRAAALYAESDPIGAADPASSTDRAALAFLLTLEHWETN